MSKYIVELKPEYEDSFKGLMILGAKDNNLFVDVLAVDDLELLNSDYINENFGQLQDTAYQKGFEDGKAQSEDGCEGCRYVSRTSEDKPCVDCSKNFDNHWTARDFDTLRGMVSGIIDSGYNADDIDKILEEMRK